MQIKLHKLAATPETKRYMQSSDKSLSELARQFGVSLDDITEVMNRYLPEIFARSSIHRALTRLGINREPKAFRTSPSVFENAKCGFIHTDLKVLTKINR